MQKQCIKRYPVSSLPPFPQSPKPILDVSPWRINRIVIYRHQCHLGSVVCSVRSVNSVQCNQCKQCSHFWGGMTSISDGIFLTIFSSFLVFVAIITMVSIIIIIIKCDSSGCARLSQRLSCSFLPV